MSRVPAVKTIIVSLRLSINEHLTSVGEEMSCVLEKQQRDVCSVQIDVRVFVLECLSAVERFVCELFQREMETLETLLEKQDKLLKLHRADVSSMTVQHMVVEPQKRGRQRKPGRPRKRKCGGPVPSPTLQCVVIQPKKRKPGRPRKHKCGGPVPSPLPEEERAGRDEEREDEMAGEDEERTGRRYDDDPTWHPDFLHLPETLLEEKSEDDDDDDENRETEHVASTSTEHMKTQADDSEAIDDDWEETREGHFALNTLKSQKSQNVKGKKKSLSKKLSQGPTSSIQTPSMKSQSGKKSYICTFCGKCCTGNTHLQCHLRVHTGEKPYTCTFCDKGFTQPSNLKVHMRVHTGEKPFMCTVCGKCCNHSSHLKSHMMTHTEKGSTSYVCEVCGKRIKSLQSLKRHMKTHTGVKPFSCTVCGKAFLQNYNLQMHMRLHTGEKHYFCRVCGDGFSQKGSLQTHMSVHTDELFCKFCGKLFADKCHLQKHMRKKHTGVKHL